MESGLAEGGHRFLRSPWHLPRSRPHFILKCSALSTKTGAVSLRGSPFYVQKEPGKCGRILNVSKRFIRQREAMEEKISSLAGKLLRVNRSILAEGTFAYIKEDMNFRRFLLRGREKVKAEWLLLSLALNILKLHHKIQNGRLGKGLIIPEDFPAGL